MHDALHPVEIFEALREYLQPSASFAIYSTYLQPLSHLLEKMNSSKYRDVVNARVEELLTREMQMFPLRAHAHMTIDGRSGYVLTGQVVA